MGRRWRRDGGEIGDMIQPIEASDGSEGEGNGGGGMMLPGISTIPAIAGTKRAEDTGKDVTWGELRMRTMALLWPSYGPTMPS